MSSGPDSASCAADSNCSKEKSLEERRQLMFERLNARHVSKSGNAPKATATSASSNLTPSDELQARVRQLLDDPNATIELPLLKEVENALSILPTGLQSRRLTEAYSELKIRLQRQLGGTQPKSAFAFSIKPSIKATTDQPRLEQSSPNQNLKAYDAGDINASGDLKPTSVATATGTVATDNTINVTDKQDDFIKVDGYDGEDVSLNAIRNCRIAIAFGASTVHLKDVDNSVVVLAPVSSSILIRNCNNLTLIAAAQQIRVHTSHHLKMYIAVRGAIIIEHCDDVLMAPYSVKNVTVEWQNDNWRNVQDFNWLSDKTNPHYRVADESLWYTYDMDTCEPCVP